MRLTKDMLQVLQAQQCTTYSSGIHSVCCPWRGDQLEVTCTWLSTTSSSLCIVIVHYWWRKGVRALLYLAMWPAAHVQNMISHYRLVEEWSKWQSYYTRESTMATNTHGWCGACSGCGGSCTIRGRALLFLCACPPSTLQGKEVHPHTPHGHKHHWMTQHTMHAL